MSDPIPLVCWAICVVVLIFLYESAAENRQKHCKAQGGTIVRTETGSVCAKVEVLS